MYNKILTVTAINNYIKRVLDNDFILKNSYIKGELSNVKIHSSGHIYFSLKDSGAKIKCVMFRSKAAFLKFIPRDGMQVVVSGNVSVYEKEGDYQLYCNTMEAQGEGELYLAFNKLKEKLEKEGLFDQDIKKPIPMFPRRIGVVTSPTGAAIRDIIKVSTRRNPKVDLLLYPALVQGIDAAPDIARGIRKLNQIEDVDLIMVARGGGSIEDLWAFNEEEVARAIAESKKPVITGVGHETDFTIADFVSDYRAATPSHAAEVSVFDLESLYDRIEGMKDDMTAVVSDSILDNFNHLNEVSARLKLYSPENFIVNQYQRLDALKERLNYKVELSVKEESHRIKILGEKLIASNPLNILNKGYSVLRDEDGNTIETLKKLNEYEKVRITMKDGSKLYKIEPYNK